MSIPGNNAVLINVLSDKHTGCDLIIGATHLKAKHGFEERRRAQTESCIAVLKEVASKHPTASVILCGDFNGEPSEPFYSTLQHAGYVSAFVTATGELLLQSVITLMTFYNGGFIVVRHEIIKIIKIIRLVGLFQVF